MNDKIDLTYFKKIIVLAIIVVIMGFGSIFLILQSLGDPCINEIICEEISPDGKYKAVGFIRDCGATTDFSPQVSILKKEEKLPNRSGNVFIGDRSQGIKVKWEDEKTLIIKHNVSGADIFKQEKSFDNIKIKYENY